MSQITNTVLMIRPAQFRMNEQTSVNNYYQKDLENALPEAVNKMVMSTPAELTVTSTTIK